MRSFNADDRKKKSNRINLPDNPGNLPAEVVHQLEQAVKANVKDGCVKCLAGWEIANNAGVSRLDVGAMIDKLGIRVTECQLGCFKVSKTPYTGSITEPLNEEAISCIKSHDEAGELTCKIMHDLAHNLNVKPLSIANAANTVGCKIQKCQLGCF